MTDVMHLLTSDHLEIETCVDALRSSAPGDERTLARRRARRSAHVPSARRGGGAASDGARHPGESAGGGVRRRARTDPEQSCPGGPSSSMRRASVRQSRCCPPGSRATSSTRSESILPATAPGRWGPRSSGARRRHRPCAPQRCPAPVAPHFVVGTSRCQRVQRRPLTACAPRFESTDVPRQRLTGEPPSSLRRDHRSGGDDRVRRGGDVLCAG